MTLELTPAEAEILISVLHWAEQETAMTGVPIALALADLRPWRSALLGAYLKHCSESAKASAAVAGNSEEGKASQRASKTS